VAQAPAPAPQINAQQPVQQQQQQQADQTDYSHGRGSKPSEPFNQTEIDYLHGYNSLSGGNTSDADRNKDVVDWGWISCNAMTTFNRSGAAEATDLQDEMASYGMNSVDVVVAAANYLCPENHPRLG
jgi:hypothetical protein